jgi:chorismate lyase / 3-hydroxybenzoate synthase
MGNDLSQTIALRFIAGGVPGRIWADTGGGVLFQAGLPFLTGQENEVLVAGGTVEALSNGMVLQSIAGLAGVLIAPSDVPLAEATHRLYEQLLCITDGQRLYRIWNFVPQINQEMEGMENYRSFNRGRHAAFVEYWGQDLTNKLPAASALGTPDGPLMLAFSAGTAPVRYFENPLQVPAIEYPYAYGRIPPAFARGSAVELGGETTWHLSGTASIRGSDSCGQDFATQMQLTLENIATICAHMDIPATRCAAWKIFLRHPEHLAASLAAMQRAYPQDADRMMFLQADICRADLLVEIEAAFTVRG